MPAENLEDEGLPKNPNLELAQLKFHLELPKNKNDAAAKSKLLEAIKTDNMAPLYEELCKDLGWKMDDKLMATMKTANGEKLKQLDEAIEDAEKNLGETEIRDALLDRAEYLSKIGDKAEALTQFRKTYDKTVALGYRLDVVFHLIRLGLFYMDHDLINKNLEKAQTLIDEGGDWDRRNRLKVYRGVYCMSIRQFKEAATLFLDTIATFTSYELMDYPKFVTYTVLCSVIALERPKLREKVTKGSEILEVLHGLPQIKRYLFSLYDCHYSEFFLSLAGVEELMKSDRLMAAHFRHYVREMRIMAYAQLLESYRSLTLQYMADAFGTTVYFIDQELARFIAAGRLHCKIDKVGGIVETNRPDSKNWQYQSTIKHGDILLNRVQKLSRVINI
ncbi:26S proteasome non-ATPase regulatory subunit 6-like [Littorina saxatilis]|uniref:26S proteasome non-ATPase regulatory subunit 6 n=1 Tax=Littorina saxatilis TaxID=31220 RepID=A0AAN9BAC1_9CAEN